MLAARWWGRGDVRVEDVADPGSPREGWVRLRVEACGICGTDLEEYRAGPMVIPREPHPLTGKRPPVVLGHESVGVVEEAGAGVGLAPGTAVAVEGNMYCGTCWWCSRRQYHLCAQLACIGLMADGGLAEHLLAPAAMCAPLSRGLAPSPGLPFEIAALAEPLSVAVRAVRRRAVVGEETTVGVLGAGTIGLLCVYVAKLSGARRVLAVDSLAERRALAVALGADAAVAPGEAAAVAREMTDGVGLDCVFEAAGMPAAAAAAVALARRGGRAVLMGVFGGTVPIEQMDLLMGEKEVVASLSHVYDDDFTTAVALLESGGSALAALVTDRIALDEVVERGFKALIANPAEHLKVVVLPQGRAA